MGLSFHAETSLVEALGSLQFATDDPRTGSISQDGSLSSGPYDPNVTPELEMISIAKERRDDDIGGIDEIQMIDR